MNLQYILNWQKNNPEKVKRYLRIYREKINNDPVRKRMWDRKMKRYYRAYRLKNCEELKSYRIKWLKDNPQKKKFGYYKSFEAYRNSRLFYKYGITLNQYNCLFNVQKGLCLICRSRKKILCVDHDHKTGKVRGLLCDFCNKGLGYFKDDMRLILRSVEYLKNNL